MRVKLQCTYYHAKGMAAPEDELDVDDVEGQDLVDQGKAVKVDAPSKPVKKAAQAPAQTKPVKKVAAASTDSANGTDSASGTDGANGTDSASGGQQ